MNINNTKAALIQAIAATRLQRLLGFTGQGSATNLLFHSFFGEQESLSHGRERLKRMCDWLRTHYTPISATEYLTCLKERQFPRNALFVTVDDARRAVLDVIDIFRDFEIPLTIFAPIGWIDEASASDTGITLPRLVTLIEHYRGSPQEFSLPGGETLAVGGADQGTAIDRLLLRADQEQAVVEHVWHQLHTTLRHQENGDEMCTWKELTDLVATGISLESHSVSHCRLGKQSAQRIQYEICESHRVLKSRFERCDMFAYPYGTWDVHNDMTSAALRAAGYQCAFLVHAGFGLKNDPYVLPRIDIPDQQISDGLFAALVQGGQIPLIFAKNILTARKHSQRSE